MLERFPSLALRVISVTLPEPNGRGFVTYYACPDLMAATDEETYPYYPLGHAVGRTLTAVMQAVRG